jgi:hypothetical protein
MLPQLKLRMLVMMMMTMKMRKTQMILPSLDEILDPEKVKEYMDQHMKEKWFPSGILSFALWGPIRPDGCDKTYMQQAASTESMDELSYGNGSKNKSKDGRGSMRNEN